MSQETPIIPPNVITQLPPDQRAQLCSAEMKALLDKYNCVAECGVTKWDNGETVGLFRVRGLPAQPVTQPAEEPESTEEIEDVAVDVEVVADRESDPELSAPEADSE